MHPPPPPHYRDSLLNAPHAPSREGQNPKAPPEPSDGDRAASRGREAAVIIESIDEPDLQPATPPSESAPPKAASQRQQEQRGGGERAASGSAAPSEPPPQPSATAANWDASSPAERPVERKSYSLARRTRSRPADLGSKQPSVEDPAACSTSSPSNTGGKAWSGPPEGLVQASGGGALTELEQDVARISLAGQAWSQSPTSYIRSEMRGEITATPLMLPPL